MTLTRNHWLAIGGAALLLALLIAWFFLYIPAARSAKIGTGYAAKYVCSCIFVQARGLEECRADLGPDLAVARVRHDAARGEVSAAITLLASDIAFHDEGHGCRLR